MLKKHREKLPQAVTDFLWEPGTWEKGVTPQEKCEQFKLIYDYIKFHIGLYLATPPVIALIAESFSVQGSECFQSSLAVMIFI